MRVEIQTLCQQEVDLFEVPGAFEVPLHAKRLAQRGKYLGIVAAGLEVNGGRYRHDFVAQSVIDGLMQVQLEQDTPIFSAILTPHHFQANEEHKQFFRQHLVGNAIIYGGVPRLWGSNKKAPKLEASK